MRTEPTQIFVRMFSSAALSLGLLVTILYPQPSQAQSVVTAVNGDPITSIDLEEYAKMLRVARKPAGRNDALEAAIADHLKYDEARKFGIDASDSDVQSVLARMSGDAKLEPQAFLQAIQRAKVDTDTFKAHLRALGAWNAYIRVSNKTLGVSEEEISAQLVKGGAAKITDYNLRQIVFVLPVKPTAADIEARGREAKSLRDRFTDCQSGLSLARGLPEVAVKEPLNRASDVLSAALRKTLADTPDGHLTAPERTASGIEMIAVCNKTEDSDQTTLRERVQKEILQDKLQVEAERKYRELRKTAVISKG